jgi:hypothetical protein
LSAHFIHLASPYPREYIAQFSIAVTPAPTEVVGHNYLICITRAAEQAPDPSNPYLAVEFSHFLSASFTT